jgi:hypothetical protein
LLRAVTCRGIRPKMEGLEPAFARHIPARQCLDHRSLIA